MSADGTDVCDGLLQRIAAFCCILQPYCGILQMALPTPVTVQCSLWQLIASYCSVLRCIADEYFAVGASRHLLRLIAAYYRLLQLIAAYYILLRRIAWGGGRQVSRAELEAAREEAAARAKEAERLRRALDATVPHRNKGLAQLVAACFAGSCCGGGARSARRCGTLPLIAVYCVRCVWMSRVLRCAVLRLLHPVRPFAALSAAYCSSVQLTAAHSILSCDSLNSSLLWCNLAYSSHWYAVYCSSVQLIAA